MITTTPTLPLSRMRTPPVSEVSIVHAVPPCKPKDLHVTCACLRQQHAALPNNACTLNGRQGRASSDAPRWVRASDTKCAWGRSSAFRTCPADKRLEIETKPQSTKRAR